jgi:hypothetical protein
MLEAKVKDIYRSGAVRAFSGQEYIRGEWRAVPTGFEPAALVHPLLDTREAGGEEVKVAARGYLAGTPGTADAYIADVEQPVTMETAEEEEPKKRSRKPSKKEE